MTEGEEVSFSEQESLQLITRMIKKAKDDFIETGISALLWGSIIPFCSLVQFASAFYNRASKIMVKMQLAVFG